MAQRTRRATCKCVEYVYTKTSTNYYLWRLPIGSYYLIYWEEEDAVSSVKADVIGGEMSVGQQCLVRMGKREYPGKIAGCAKPCDLLILHNK